MSKQWRERNEEKLIERFTLAICLILIITSMLGKYRCPQLLIKAYAVQYIIDDIRLILLHPVGDAEKTIWC